MSAFQPLGCGFGRSVIVSESGATSDATASTSIMDNTAESTGDLIVRLISESGGSITSIELQKQMPEVAPANRSYHARRLVETGRIVAKGKTLDRSYHLPTKANKAPAKPAKAAEQVLAIVEGRKDRDRLIDAGHVVATAAMVESLGPHLIPLDVEAPVPVAPFHLRRLLTMALSRPGDIGDSEREALHAIAQAVC